MILEFLFIISNCRIFISIEYSTAMGKCKGKVAPHYVAVTECITPIHTSSLRHCFAHNCLRSDRSTCALTLNLSNYRNLSRILIKRKFSYDIADNVGLASSAHGWSHELTSRCVCWSTRKGWNSKLKVHQRHISCRVVVPIIFGNLWKIYWVSYSFNSVKSISYGQV